MSAKQYCRECKQALALGTTACSCGWQIDKATDHRCQYQSQGRRCPLPGTMCHHPYGSVWYCPGHWESHGDAKRGAAALLDAEQNYEKIMEGHIDWRRKLWMQGNKNGR